MIRRRNSDESRRRLERMGRDDPEAALRARVAAWRSLPVSPDSISIHASFVNEPSDFSDMYTAVWKDVPPGSGVDVIGIFYVHHRATRGWHPKPHVEVYMSPWVGPYNTDRAGSTVVIDIDPGRELEDAWRWSSPEEKLRAVAAWAMDPEVQRQLRSMAIGAAEGRGWRHNPDEPLRRAQREAAAGDFDARVRYLTQRARSGQLDLRRVELAARLGDEASAAVVGHSWPLIDRLEAMEVAEGLLGQPAVVSYAADVAERVLPVFELTSGDLSPRRAIEAARAWAAHPCNEHRADAEHAELLARDLVNPIRVRRTATMWAADAAAWAAGAVRTEDPIGMVLWPSWSADRAMYSALRARTTDANQAWQRQRLIDYLLGEA